MDDLKPERSMENIKHATAEHQRTTGHTVAFDYPEIIASTQWKSQLNTYENIAIKKYNAYPPKGLNRDFGPQISPAWQALHQKCNFKPRQLQL